MSLVYKIGLSVEMEALWLVLYTQECFCIWFSFYSTLMVKSALANILSAHAID